jgi:hypothetical protein
MATKPIKILHDDKSANVWTTEGKVVNFLWPDMLTKTCYEDQNISSFTVEGEISPGSKKQLVKGKTDAINPGDSIIYFMSIQAVPGAATEEITVNENTKVPVYYHTGIEDENGYEKLKPFRFVKFPKVWWDAGTRRLHMLYWTNLFIAPYNVNEQTIKGVYEERTDGTQLDEQGNILNVSPPTKPDAPDNTEIIGLKNDTHVEPWTPDKPCDFIGQRALFYAEGNEYLVWTTRTGERKKEMMWLFQPPVKVTEGGRWDCKIPEPVMDIHPDPISLEKACSKCCDEKKGGPGQPSGGSPDNIVQGGGYPITPIHILKDVTKSDATIRSYVGQVTEGTSPMPAATLTRATADLPLLSMVHNRMQDVGKPVTPVPTFPMTSDLSLTNARVMSTGTNASSIGGNSLAN